MPYACKPLNGRKQLPMDDLAIAQLDAAFELPSRFKMKATGKSWEQAIRRTKLHVRRKVIRVCVGSVMHTCEISSYDRLSELSVEGLSDDYSEDFSTNSLPSIGLRATSEPPCLGSPYCDSEASHVSAGDHLSSSSSVTSQLLICSSTSVSTKSVVSSMSRRRIASNIPALDSRLCIPSSLMNTALEASSLTSGPSTPSLCQSLSNLTLFEASSVPRTPECQLIRKRRSPPDAPRQANINAKYKLSLTSSISLQNMNYPSYPFTPLDDELQSSSLPKSIQGGTSTGLEALLPQHGRIQQAPTTSPVPQQWQPSSPHNSLDLLHSTRPQAIDLLRRRAFPVPTRRGPFNRCNSSPGLSSPHSAFHSRSSMTQPNGLASPLILDAAVYPLASPHVSQPSPLQQSVGFPASPGYFNLKASRK